jgi:2-keto-4-pentenoate hydratase
MSFNPVVAARFIEAAHKARNAYANLPADIAPQTVDEAYAAQDALATIWEPARGPVAGLKIATTTRVMQALMGINHPCGGLIFQQCVHQSPARLDPKRFMHMVVECELAVRIGVDLVAQSQPYDRTSARLAVASIMPAFELIEDRNAVYRETNALSLIADNAWNGGIVLGPETIPTPDQDLNGLTGNLKINGIDAQSGQTDDPMGALAWVANLALSRGRALRAGMVVITGSVIPTLPIADGDTFSFAFADGVPVTMTTILR